MSLRKNIAALSILIFSPMALMAADDEIILLGKQTYDAQCARCHGTQGKGDGMDAPRLYIPPRDLTSGRFKFKSTASGTPPSDDDLIKGVLGHGVTGSGMPSFANLEEPVKFALVQYIKTFSTAFQGTAPQPIPHPANMKASVDLKKGAEIYEKLQCALCHGVNGRANGTSAAALQDAWGHPIKPTNLSQGWTYGGGPKAIDVYHRIMAGIDGAPMPSYDGAVTREEAWILSKYVESLQLKANWSDDIYTLKVEGALPALNNDEIWNKVPRTDIVLDTYYVQNGRRVPMTVNAVSVQAVANKEGVAFRLVWDDPVKSDKSAGDGVLVAVKPFDYNGDSRGTLHSLYAAEASSLDLMIWSSDIPETVLHQKSNLASQAKSSNRGTFLKTASSNYDDGRWTLIFSRPFSDSFPVLNEKNAPLQLAFSVWSGENGESLLKSASSRWMRLQAKKKQVKH